jgi:hypothetical protein
MTAISPTASSLLLAKILDPYRVRSFTCLPTLVGLIWIRSRTDAASATGAPRGNRRANPYGELIRLLGVQTRNIRLLTGKSTHKFALETEHGQGPKSYADDFLWMELTKEDIALLTSGTRQERMYARAHAHSSSSLPSISQNSLACARLPFMRNSMKTRRHS